MMKREAARSTGDSEVENRRCVAELFAEGFGKQTELKGASEQLRHIPDVQSSHQVKAMNFHRAHADLQHIGNLTVRMSDGDQPENVPLSWRQQFKVDGLFDQRLTFSS
jgi:hypothetical protein